MNSLDKRSKYLRKLILQMVKVKRGGHLAPALSLVEILRVLYDSFLKYKVKEIDWQDRDRLIFSKGHGCLALYAILADKGFINLDELNTFCEPKSRLGGHPERHKIPGVEISAGSLGHGLPIAVGISLAAKIKKKNFKVITVVGDGEINEGSNWEAAMTASKHKLSNLTLIIDFNKFQSYGPTSEVLEIEPLSDKLKSFGFCVSNIDGHNIKEIEETLKKLPFDKNKPSSIICNTIKGKGLAFAESNASWHHKSNLKIEDINEMYGLLE